MTSALPVTIVDSGSSPVSVNLSVYEQVNAQTGTTYTILAGDWGKLVTFSNGASIAVTLPQANSTTFPNGWYTDIQNLGAGTVTITPTTSTINGGSSLALGTGVGIRVVSDGTNYQIEGVPNPVLLAGNQTVAGVKTFSSALSNSANVGTANTGSTAVERGDGRTHQTVLTVSTTLPAITGGVAQGLGKLLYTFPTGAVIIESSYFSLAITQSQGHINADTPDVGLGTVIASGVISVLDGTATFENIVTGQTAADCNGTATVITAIPTANVPFIIAAGDAHTIYFNAAATWAALGDSAATLAGSVVINWRFMA